MRPCCASSVRSAESSRTKKISQQRHSVAGQNRFGMELYAVDREFAVPQTHDLAFGRFGRDLERIWEGLAVHDQRMIAGRFEGIGQIFEDASALMLNGRSFPMHQARRGN